MFLKTIKYFIIFIVLIYSNQGLSQIQHPVSVNGSIKQPMSPYISEIISPSKQNIQIYITFNDHNESKWEGYLKLKITGNNVIFKSKHNIKPNKTIVLTPGITTKLTSNDINHYFDFSYNEITSPNNIISQKKRFPEGFYNIEISFHDFNSGKQISNIYKSVILLELEEAPRCILPTKSSILSPDNYNIIFNWQHKALNNNLNYILSIYESNKDLNKNCIYNGKCKRIFQSPKTHSFHYLLNNADFYLKEGFRYYWNVKAINQKGIEFKNDGFSNNMHFYYGYPSNGKIKLKSPINNYAFKLRDRKKFIWKYPDNLTTNQNYSYVFKIFNVENKNPDFKKPFYKYETNKIYSKTDYSHIIEKKFQSQKEYAWKVEAYTNKTKIASSELYFFKGPPFIEAFNANNHKVYVTECYNNDLSNLSGKGEVKISDNKRIEVFFKNVKIEKEGAVFLLKKGKVRGKWNGDPIIYKSDLKENNDIKYSPDSVILDKHNMYSKGVIEWILPLETNNTDIPKIKVKDAQLYFNGYIPSGIIYFEKKRLYHLVDPENFSIEIFKESYFSLRSDQTCKFRFKGLIICPKNVKQKNDSTYKLPFNSDEIKYINQKKNYNKKLKTGKGINIWILPDEYTIDLSDNRSVKNLNKNWKGVYLHNYRFLFEPKTESSNQLQFKNAKTITTQSSNKQKSYISSWGLFINNKIVFKKNSTASWFNTFPGYPDTFQIKTEESIIKNGFMKGRIDIPFLSDTSMFKYSLPLDANGFNTGYLSESLRGFKFVKKPNNLEQKVNLEILRGVFSEKQRLDITLKLNWPFIKYNNESITGLSIWGNYDIGFYKPNGSKYLENQKQISLKDYSVNIEKIGVGRQGNLYSIAMSGSIVMGEDVSGKNGPPVTNFYSIEKK